MQLPQRFKLIQDAENDAQFVTMALCTSIYAYHNMFCHDNLPTRSPLYWMRFTAIGLISAARDSERRNDALWSIINGTVDEFAQQQKCNNKTRDVAFYLNNAVGNAVSLMLGEYSMHYSLDEPLLIQSYTCVRKLLEMGLDGQLNEDTLNDIKKFTVKNFKDCHISSIEYDLDFNTIARDTINALLRVENRMSKKLVSLPSNKYPIYSVFDKPTSK